MTEHYDPPEVAYLTLPEIAHRFRRSQSAVLNWTKRGVDTPSGVVRLRAMRVGGVWLVDVRDLETFLAAQNPDRHVAVTEQQDTAARLREQECAALDRQLRRDPNEKE